MPNEKVLSEKQQVVAELAARIQASASGVICDYRGITVEQDTKLRKQLRKAGVEYTVVKNTLLTRALKDTAYEELGGLLNDTTSFATSEDPLAAAKVISEYSKSVKGAFAVKGGFVDGKVIDPAGVEQLASIPSKEILIAQFLGGLTATIRGLAVAIQAIADKQSEGEPAAQEA
mgnify:CR=1 FL=1